MDKKAAEGIDQILDVTAPWPFTDLDYVYGEEFLEHLQLEGALDMLGHAWNSLRVGGTIRLSTPSLEWVLATHFPDSEKSPDRRINNTFMTNRAFHGWGHQFLYSREMLASMLEHTGWEQVRFCDYGRSEDPNLAGRERHGGFRTDKGFPSVWIVEADRAAQLDAAEVEEYRRLLHRLYGRYVDTGP